MINNESGTILIFGICQTIFGNINRFFIARQTFQNMENAFGINFPPSVTARTAARAEVKSANQTAIIIIYPDKILIILYPIEKTAVPEPSHQRRRPTLKI